LVIVDVVDITLVLISNAKALMICERCLLFQMANGTTVMRFFYRVYCTPQTFLFSDTRGCMQAWHVA